MGGKLKQPSTHTRTVATMCGQPSVHGNCSSTRTYKPVTCAHTHTHTHLTHLLAYRNGRFLSSCVAVVMMFVATNLEWPPQTLQNCFYAHFGVMVLYVVYNICTLLGALLAIDYGGRMRKYGFFSTR